MRGRICLVMVAIVLVTVSVPSCDASDGDLLITAVCPSYPGEWFSITNNGESSISLDRVTVTDGEGWARLPAVPFPPGGDACVVMEGAVADLLPDMPIITQDMLSTGGSLRLADNGDDLTLMVDDVAVDTVVWGSASIVDGWSGPPVDRPGRGESIVRTGWDTDTRSDWCEDVPGRSRFTPVTDGATVEPFTVPEDGSSRIVREIRMASIRLWVCVYEFDSPMLMTELCVASERGVDVRIIVDGAPVGGMSLSSRMQFATMTSSGVEVRCLTSTDGYRRYDHVHSKYCVIDGHRSLVMSDNWMDSSLSMDRGWGCVVESDAIASSLTAIHEFDWSNPLDMMPFDDTNVAHERTVDTLAIDTSDIVRYDATATLVVSPDNSMDAVSSMIAECDVRLDVEMFYIHDDWLPGGLVDDVIDAATRGVGTRVLLDGSWFNVQEGGNERAVDTLNLIAQGRRLPMEARLVSEYHPFDLIHNKAVVADDSVLFSSMNWCPSAFECNREVGIIVQSQEVSDLMHSCLMEDWVIDPEPPVIDLSGSRLEAEEGGMLLLCANGSRDDAGIASVEWDVGDDGSIDRVGAMVPISLPPGDHVIRVTVTDGSGLTNETSVIARVTPAPDGFPLWPLPVGTASSVVVLMMVKRLRSRADTR